MNKKFIAFSDCDGTLLFDNHTFTDYTKQVVKKVYQNGNYLIPVTARTLKNLRTIASQLEIDKLGGIVAGNNGAQIYDFKNNCYILNAVLDKQLIEDIFELYYNDHQTAQTCKVSFNAEATVFAFGRSDNTIKWASIMEQKFKVVTTPQAIDEEIVSIAIVTKKGTTLKEYLVHFNKIKHKYQDNYQIDNYHNRVISIAPKQIDKGYAVQKIKEYLAPNEYVTYGFGDSYNDFSLLKNVDVGIAMKNGLDELKAIAHQVSDWTNDEDGVARYIQEKIIDQQ